MRDSHKTTPCKFCPSLFSESSGDCPKVSIWALRWGLRALEQEQIQPKRNPDQRQAGYEVGFCLVLVPFNNWNDIIYHILYNNSDGVTTHTCEYTFDVLQDLNSAVSCLFVCLQSFMRPRLWSLGRLHFGVLHKAGQIIQDSILSYTL